MYLYILKLSLVRLGKSEKAVDQTQVYKFASLALIYATHYSKYSPIRMLANFKNYNF
jgi:hypothetical protein